MSAARSVEPRPRARRPAATRLETSRISAYDRNDSVSDTAKTNPSGPRAARARASGSVRRAVMGRASVNESSDSRDDLRDGPSSRYLVGGDRDVESSFELCNDFKHLQRVESKVGDEIARQRRLDRTSADILQDFEDGRFDGRGVRHACSPSISPEKRTAQG